MTNRLHLLSARVVSCSSKKISCCERKATLEFGVLKMGALLKTPVFWDVALRPWVSSSRILEGWLIPSLSAFRRRFTLKMKLLRSFKLSGTSRPMTQHNAPQALYFKKKKPNNRYDSFEKKIVISTYFCCIIRQNPFLTYETVNLVFIGPCIVLIVE